MAANRDGAVQAANKIVRAVAPDWSVRRLDVDARGTVHVILESYDATSGTPWADLHVQVALNLYDETP